MGIFGHMTSNSPLKASEGDHTPEGGGGDDGKPSTDPGGASHMVQDTKEFMKNLDSQMSTFSAKVESSLKDSSFKGTSATAPPPSQTTPHFTIDDSPTRPLDQRKDDF